MEKMLLFRRTGTLENRLDLRAEQDRTAALGPVERLDSEAVADQQQTSTTSIVKRQRKHPDQSLRERIAPFLVGVRNDLRVTAALKDVPGGLELAAQFPMVVDLAIEDDLYLTIFAGHGLPAKRAVNQPERAAVAPKSSHCSHLMKARSRCA